MFKFYYRLHLIYQQSANNFLMYFMFITVVNFNKILTFEQNRKSQNHAVMILNKKSSALVVQR